MEQLHKLLEPGRIGRIELNNRIVMPPMVTMFATYEGLVTEQHIDYYVERAKGGVGLIIIEATYIDSWSSSGLTLRIDKRKHIFGFAELVKSIHMYGTKVALQLMPGHGSWVSPKEVGPQYQRLGPTKFAFPGTVAHPLRTAEIKALIKDYGAAAEKARIAGFDAIEIHGAGSYLLAQFMSPYVNKRTDKYGLLWRLPMELLQSVKAQAGPDFPVFIKLAGDEFIKDGRNVETSKKICQRLEEVGLDAIEVTGGTHYKPESDCIMPYMTMPNGTFLPQAQEIKKAVKIPVIVPGKLSDPTDAENALRDGKADFIAVGRGLIADPEWAKKLAEGREKDIRPCIYCNEGCRGAIQLGRRLGCQVNAQAGKEKEFKIEQATKPKKVLIIGGGPGGMEAARVAALKGHSVTLYEKEDRLGGHLIEAANPEHKKDLRPLITWLSSQLKEAGVKVVMNKEVTPEFVLKKKPGAVIVATGSTQKTPEIAGVRSSNVVQATDVLRGKAEVGDKIIVVGGGSVGCDVAAFLADKGKNVTIVEMLSNLAFDLEELSYIRDQLLIVLAKKDVRCITDMKVEEITGEGVIAINKKGAKRKIKADNVVVAAGFKKNAELYESLEDKIPVIHIIGDSAEPRKIGDAILEGFFWSNAI